MACGTYPHLLLAASACQGALKKIVKKNFHPHHLLKLSTLKPYESLFHGHFCIACRYLFFITSDHFCPMDRFRQIIFSKNSTCTTSKKISNCKILNRSGRIDRLWLRFTKK